VSADTPNDRDLEELLAEAAALRQQYRVASQEEPSVALDEAIRAAARREVRARPLMIGSGFGGSWRVPASIAAVVVVSVTVAVMVSPHDPQLRATREGPSSGLPATVGAPKDQAEPARGDRTAKEQPKVDPTKAAPQARPSAAVPAPSSPAPAEARIEKSELRAKIESPIARTASEREEPLRTQTSAKTALPAEAEALAPTMAAKTMAAPPAAEAAAKATADGTVSEQPLTKKRAQSNFAEAESKASPWEKDPQTWLAHIEELRAAGRMQDAEASFRAFRGRYPDYQLPHGFVPPVPPVSN
jgi:hypothetical protein